MIDALTSMCLSADKFIILWVLLAAMRKMPLPLSACHVDSKGDLQSVDDGLQLQILDLIGMSLISSYTGCLAIVIYGVPVLQNIMQNKMQCMHAFSWTCTLTTPVCVMHAPLMAAEAHLCIT